MDERQRAVLRRFGDADGPRGGRSAAHKGPKDILGVAVVDVLILMGSPRQAGNTARSLEPVQEVLRAQGHRCRTVRLYEKELRGCTACRTCQKDWSVFGCPQHDDMQEIFDLVLSCDLLILATPIYSWYCTPPMKAVLDRLVYGMNKYYGGEKGPALWAGKPVALVSTCGYRPGKGADLWEEGMRRYCKHSQLRYLGMLAERHLGYDTVFMDWEKAERAAHFAAGLCRKLDGGEPAAPSHIPDPGHI